MLIGERQSICLWHKAVTSRRHGYGIWEGIWNEKINGWFRIEQREGTEPKVRTTEVENSFPLSEPEDQ